MTDLELEELIADHDMLAARVLKLQTENDLFRAALDEIAFAPPGACGPDLKGCIRIARAALAEEGKHAEPVCVNAHDRCYGGAGGPCPYCEMPAAPGR
jgi:hypothetical protein